MTTDNANIIQIVQEPPPSTTSLAHTAPMPSTFVRSRTIFDLNRDEFERLAWLATAYTESAFNSGNNRYGENDFKLIMLKGLELGIPPMAAVDLIDVIHGKPSLSAKGMLALVQASGELEDIQIESTNTYCTVTVYRRGKTPYTETFSEADARKFMTSEGYGQNRKTIPLWDKANWKSQPRIMLKWRAVTAALRATFPDRTGGLYTHEELDPDNVIVTDDGAMQVERSQAAIPATTTPATSKKKAQPEPDDNSDAKKTPPAWIGNQEQMRGVVSKAVEAGYIEKPATLKAGKEAILQFIGQQDFNEFATPGDANTAIQAVGEKLQAELNNRNADKSQADESEQPESTPPTAIDKTPESSDEIVTLSNKDKAELADWIVANFAGRDMAQVGEELNTDFSDCTSIGYAKNKLMALAGEQCWSIITDMISHKQQGKTSYLLFHSPVDEIRIYSRKDLVSKLGEDFPDTDKIKTLPTGEHMILSEKIVMEFEPKGHYNNVTNATPLSKWIPF